MAQESMDDWMGYAKDLAKAERELGIEHWVYITFEIRDSDRNRNVLHTIDIPHEMLERWRWLINWRKAKLICRYPRKNVEALFCYYDKRTGLHTGFDFILGKVASAKAQITKVERNIARYIDYRKHNDLFFNMGTDVQLQKAYAKLEQKKENYQKTYMMLQEEVKRHWENSNKYKLFIGFKKLGEFDSISEAKRYAQDSGLTGAFNLLGDKYRDAWYVYEQEAKRGKAET
jgi:hypothetical protein